MHSYLGREIKAVALEEQSPSGLFAAKIGSFQSVFSAHDVGQVSILAYSSGGYGKLPYSWELEDEGQRPLPFQPGASAPG